MRCEAMLFNLEKMPKRDKPGVFNHFMTFVDMDTGESFRTFVDTDIAQQYRRLKQVQIRLSLSMGEYNGKPQLNCRVIEMSDVLPDFPSSVEKPIDSSPTLVPKPNPMSPMTGAK